MKSTAQWGLYLPTGWDDWEEHRLETSTTAVPTMTDENEQKREVLLVDTKGEPLIVRAPRPVGFRRP